MHSSAHDFTKNTQDGPPEVQLHALGREHRNRSLGGLITAQVLQTGPRTNTS